MKDLSELTINELHKVIEDANRLIRRKEYEANMEREKESKSKLSVGDIVSVSGKKFVGEIWEVLKLNTKKAKCKRENGETWNIPYSHIIMD